MPRPLCKILDSTRSKSYNNGVLFIKSEKLDPTLQIKSASVKESSIFHLRLLKQSQKHQFFVSLLNHKISWRIILILLVIYLESMKLQICGQQLSSHQPRKEKQRWKTVQKQQGRFKGLEELSEREVKQTEPVRHEANAKANTALFPVQPNHRRKTFISL